MAATDKGRKKADAGKMEEAGAFTSNWNGYFSFDSTGIRNMCSNLGGSSVFYKICMVSTKCFLSHERYYYASNNVDLFC